MALVKGIAWGRDFIQRIRSEDFMVHSVFQSVCNLQAHPAKPLLSLVNRPEALAPNALLVEESSFRGVCRAGEKVQVEALRLRCGEYWVDCRIMLEEVRKPLAILSGQTALKTVETWLEIYFPGFKAEYSPLRQSLKQALLQEDAVLLQAALSKLIGAGSGLTPAGDDFAAGVLLAYTRGIRAAGHNKGSPAVSGLKEGFSVDMVEIAQALLPSTNAISQTMLAYAVQGEGAQYVTAVVDGIYGNAADVVAAASELSRIGASSGRYLLAGVLLGCEIYQIKFYRIL